MNHLAKLIFISLSCCVMFAVTSHALSPVLTIPNQIDYWKNSGFVEMVGPLRLPTDETQSDQIHVWIKIPEDQKVRVQKINDSLENRYTLLFPPGTIADRVEFDTRYPGVGDVRGARLDSQGKSIFHVYETVEGGDQRILQGYEWQRQDDAADVRAGNALVQLFRFSNPQDRDNFIGHNHCAQCHTENSPSPLTLNSISLYQTDSHGFFQPTTVLKDEMTVRHHRNWDLNSTDPFISVWCGNNQIKVTSEPGSRYYRCPNNQSPIGKLDLVAALKKNDAHALQVCASRSYLYQHMDDGAKAAYAASYQECLSSLP